MELVLQGVTVTVDEKEITKLLIERLASGARPAGLRGLQIPKLGEYWAGQGGIFTGIGRGRDGDPDQFVITAETELGTGNWNRLGELAVAYTKDGHHDFTLPWRADQSLQFANIPERFKQEAYWSREQHRETSDSAWFQGFISGNQRTTTKSVELRGVAVRRFPIYVI